MSDWSPPLREAIQHEAYFLWEADGRPPGLDQEYWMRARAVLHERARLLAEGEAAARQRNRRRSSCWRGCRGRASRARSR